MAVVVYTYVGYGIILWMMVKVKEWFIKPVTLPHPTDEVLPEMTLFIAAYNEEQVVDEKMANCLDLDYPREKLHIVWCTDGSNDHTVERLSCWPQATVLHTPERKGKSAAMNRGLQFVHTPLVAFTDANTMLNRASLRLIAQAFLDQKVGCVAGEKRIQTEEKADAAQGGEGLYWRYESALKALDSRLYSAAGAAGELFAIRRELFQPLEEDTLLDDFVLSLRIVEQGYRIAYLKEAYAMESGSANLAEEEKRKVRIAAGGLQSIARLWPLFNPLRYGIFSFQYVSHRVLRWSITPVLLFALLPLNVVLLFGTERTALYVILWLLQALFYLAGSLGYYLSMRRTKNKLLFVPCYFLFMNLNVLRGMVYLSTRNDKEKGTWEKARRA
ncbi:MAG: glycosyltransferase family 2 protein [Mediterranea sp.]|nr:glycosyltransferase family 2 protein [Mediterranea sp.]